MSISFYARLQGDAFFSSAAEERGPRYFNLCNANAAALLGWLGFCDEKGGGLWDHDPVPIPDVRRAIVRARNTDGAGAWVRKTGYAKNLTAYGIDEESLRGHLDRLEAFLLEAESKGAREVYWA